MIVTDEMVERALDAYCKIRPFGVEPHREGMRAALEAALSDGVKRPLIVPIPKSEPPLEGAFVFPAENVL